MAVAQFSPTPTTTDWQRALRRWLQWNEAYEQLTARMYQAKDDPARLEGLADQLDRARHEAVAATRELLTVGGCSVEDAGEGACRR